eukprot:gene7799-15958_t
MSVNLAVSTLSNTIQLLKYQYLDPCLRISPVASLVSLQPFIAISTISIADLSPPRKVDISHIQKLLKDAWNHAISSGLSGAAAGILQVILMMWLRTTIHYQHRYGLTTIDTIKILYSQGGIQRFYNGISYAIIQAPLAKFGSMASNEGAKYCSKFIKDIKFRILFSTLLGSILASFWRMILMPIDTCKTVLQVEGASGFSSLLNNVLQGHVHLLYQGATATVLGAAITHYSWFLIYNGLDVLLKTRKSPTHNILQNAFVGFIASAFSDFISNPIRVIKTIKQSLTIEQGNQSYLNIIRFILQTDGWWALFQRGLWTRIISNGIQSMIFIVIWKLFMKSKHNNNSSNSSGNHSKTSGKHA